MASQFLKLLDQPYEAKENKNTKIAVFDGSTIKNLESFYDQITEALSFPDYFGKNLDALFELLCDLSWITKRRVEIFIDNYEDFLSDEDEDVRLDLMSVLYDAAEEWDILDDEKQLKLYINACDKSKGDLETLGYI